MPDARSSTDLLGVTAAGVDDAPWVDVPGGQRRLPHTDPARRVWALGGAS